MLRTSETGRTISLRRIISVKSISAFADDIVRAVTIRDGRGHQVKRPFSFVSTDDVCNHAGSPIPRLKSLRTFPAHDRKGASWAIKSETSLRHKASRVCSKLPGSDWTQRTFAG